jgi:hypothetical protein
MKIKKLSHYKGNKVQVEFDEFFTLGLSDRPDMDKIIHYMEESSGRRTAYNIWEFVSEEEARRVLFVMGLKL